MRVTLTGATGLIGTRIVRALRERGDDVTVLSRDPERARAHLGVEAVAWDAMAGPVPAGALGARDAVIHLAGAPIAQRWNDAARRRIHDSREVGTRNLVAGMRAVEDRPRVLASASGVGFYGARGDEELTEDAAPGDDFVARVCLAWEREAEAATGLGVRVIRMRTGVVLDAHGGALAKMLPFFRAGAGGPVAGGRQYLSWIGLDDLVGLYLAALDGDGWSGPVNATSPNPVTNREFSARLGRSLRRPAVAPVPAFAIRLLYGDMAQIVIDGQRAVPARALGLGFAFAQADLDVALRAALAG
jgi:uncharacterized protein (TIGR01777 family)